MALFFESPQTYLSISRRSRRTKRCKTNLEEVKTWERNQVHSKLPEIRVELTRESQAARYSSHDRTNKVVEVSD